MVKELIKIEEDLNKACLPTRHLLAQCKGPDPYMNNSPQFTDPKNLPFYYYLGKHLPKNKVISFGFGIGIPLSLYCLGAKSNIIYGHYDPGNDYYNCMIGINNVKRIVKKQPKLFLGDLKNIKNYISNKFDVILVNEMNDYEKTLFTLETAWELLDWGGYIVLDNSYKLEDSIKTFSILCNRIPNKIKTRNGIVIFFKD